MNMLKINKVSLVDNQFTDEELKTGGICELTAAGTSAGKGVWHFVKDGTATCVAAETDFSGGEEAKGFSCEVEKLVLKLTKKVHREIPVAADQTTIDTGLKGLNGTIGKFDDKDPSAAAKVAVEIADISSHVATVESVKDGVLTLAAGAKAGVLVVDLKVEVGNGVASHPSMDAAHKLELKAGEPLHVVLYANAKNIEGAKPNVTDFHTVNSRIGITAQ